MLIKTSPSSRQIERMLDKRAWRWRHAYGYRQSDPVDVAQAETVTSPIAVIEFAPLRKPHRPARAGKAAARVPVLAQSLQLHCISGYLEDESAASR